MEYYYLDSANEQKGPLPKGALLSNGVTKTTLVWRNGMEKWQPAGEVEELWELFIYSGSPGSIPPPPPGASPRRATQGYQGNQSSQTSSFSSFATKPDSYLIWSILTTLFCCLPLGVVAIVYSNKVDSLWNKGDELGAEKAAEEAKKYCIISAITGVVWFVICMFSGLLPILAEL